MSSNRFLIHFALVSAVVSIACADKRASTDSQSVESAGASESQPVANTGAAAPEERAGTRARSAGVKCPEGLPGAKLVQVPTSGGGSFCMDEREVINSEYKQFVDAMQGKQLAQPAECAWNDRLIPELYEPEEDTLQSASKCLSTAWKLDSDPTFAVTCVDFCDAWAYCGWAGKRLCGAHGAVSDQVNVRTAEEVDAIGNSTQNEWFDACSQGGTSKYPYGDTYEAGRCIDPTKVKLQGADAKQSKEVVGDGCAGSKPEYSGIHHLSGNVWEWENLCKDGGLTCAFQGGARNVATTADLACNTLRTMYAGTVQPIVGFRCCADTVP